MRATGKWKFGVAAAIAVTVSVAMSTAASAAVTSSSSSLSHATRPASVRPLDVTACQGSPATPNNATLSGIQYVELHTWTECYGVGVIVSVTSEVELQKWVLLYPGTGDTEGEWEDVAGPVSKSFPGALEVKFYQYASAKCSAVGGAGDFRVAAKATWEEAEDGEGSTGWGYSSGANLC